MHVTGLFPLGPFSYSCVNPTPVEMEYGGAGRQLTKGQLGLLLLAPRLPSDVGLAVVSTILQLLPQVALSGSDGERLRWQIRRQEER